MTLTQKAVREALALAEKATPGPWHMTTWGDNRGVTHPIIAAAGITIAHLHPCPATSNSELQANAAILAEFRTGYETILRDLEEWAELVRRLVVYIPTPPSLPMCEVDYRQATQRLRAYFGADHDKIVTNAEIVAKLNEALACPSPKALSEIQTVIEQVCQERDEALAAVRRLREGLWTGRAVLVDLQSVFYSICNGVYGSEEVMKLGYDTFAGRCSADALGAIEAIDAAIAESERAP